MVALLSAIVGARRASTLFEYISQPATSPDAAFGQNAIIVNSIRSTRVSAP